MKRTDPAILNSPKMTAQIIGNKPNTYTFTKVRRKALKYTDENAILIRPWESLHS